MGWRRAFIVGCVSAAFLAATTCGGRKQSSVVSLQSSDWSGGQSQERVAPAIQPAADVSIDETLVELEGMECPEGVDEELWVELKDALKEALQTELTESRPGSPARLLASPEEQDGHSMLCPYKSVATPPTGEANRVTDLAISDNGDGTFALSWHYRNLGDYDQNGTVGIEDITPLAQHYNEEVPGDDTERNSLQAVIDGSGNGRIGIEEITPIAMNFAVEVEHYAVEGAPEEAGTYELVSEIAQDMGSGEGRLEYSAIIESPAALWHRVVPYDSEGAPGEPSDAVLRPSNEPIIYEASPTEGYQHEEYTYAATVTGAEPLEYVWDFGGGASPDTSSESSPTVTLADAGEYEASLTVTNAYGQASFPFILTISERDTWAHTWGGEWDDSASDVAVDDDGNVLVLGMTYSFGAGGSDILLLKYNSDGELIFARTWGGDKKDKGMAILIGPDNGFYVVGSTASFGTGSDDVLLLKYDPSGELLFAETWGGDWMEEPRCATTDSDGNVYVAGNRSDFQFDPWDVFVLKYDYEGNLQYSVSWDDGDSDFAFGIAASGDGLAYVVGDTRTETDIRAILLIINSDGALQDSKTIAGYESLHGILFDSDENILTWGSPLIGEEQPKEIGVLKLSKEWDELWSRSLAASFSLFAVDVTAKLFGNAFLVGRSGRAHPDILAIELNGLGNVDSSISWKRSDIFSDESLNGIALDLMGNVFAVGSAPSSDGEWQDVVLTAGAISVAIEPIEGTHSVLDLTETYADGIETQVDGVQDSGGGDGDVLVMKNIPNAAG